MLDLRKQGLSYNQIIRRVDEEHGAKLRKSHVSEWLSGRHTPLGSVTAFEPNPCPELAYVIGVERGDASMSVGKKSYNYMIKLRVIDKEFAEEFSRCLSLILRGSPPRVKWHEKTHSWHTQVSSLLLTSFLRKDLKDLIPTISHCEDCKAAFLRGFFDSEGSIRERSLTASNEDLELMELVCKLLQSLGIQTTGPYLATKGGRTVMIKGKFYRQNDDLHYLRVRSRSLQTYQTKVGFAILRKSEALSVAVSKGR